MSAPRPVAPLSATERLIAELQAGGEYESEGAFTLDREQARRKMQRFQLSNPARYVLELVQAAVLKGAQRLEFTIDYADLRLGCDGEPFTAADCEHVYAAMFLRASEAGAQARRHLAVGLCTVLALDPAVVRLDSGDATGGAFLELRPGQPDRFGALGQGPEGFYTTQLRVRQRRRPQLLQRFLLGQKGRLAEQLLLRLQCTYARVAISLNGQLLAHGYRLPETTSPLQFADQDVHGLLGPRAQMIHGVVPGGTQALYQDLELTELRLIKNGVWFTTVYPAALLPGFEGIADCPRLGQDLSHEQVVQDEHYQRVIQVVLAHQIARLAADCGKALAWKGELPHWMFSELRSLLMALLQRLDSLAVLLHWAGEPVPVGLRSGLVARLPERVAQAADLLDFPLLRTSQEKWIGLRPLVADVVRYGSLAFSPEPAAEADPQRPLVLHLPDPRLRALLTRLLGCPSVDCSFTIQRAQRRQQNHAAWQEREREPRLHFRQFLVRRPILAPGLRGEVGVRKAVFPAVRAGPPPPGALPLGQESRPIGFYLRGLPAGQNAGELGSHLSRYVQQPSRLLLVRDGCLLVEKPLALPVSDLEIIVEAAFTPAALYDDVLGDATLSAALTAALTAIEPLLKGLSMARLEPELEPLRARTLRGLLWLLLADSAQLQLRLAAGVDPKVAAAEPPLPTDARALWQYLADWPLFESDEGLVSLRQIQAYARRNSGAPVLVPTEARAAPNPWYDPLARHRHELFGSQYPLSQWQAAHAQAPAIARRAVPPKLVVGIAYDEREFAGLLRAELGEAYVDMQAWLKRVREAGPQAAP